MGLNTPVLLIIFNRPDTTKQVFEAIRTVKPEKLFIVADGPRSDNKDDEEKCRLTRQVVDAVDWDCTIQTNYSDTNMGCGPRPASGISWFFEEVTEGIILEDDCVPHPDFFTFCELLLEHHRNNEKIMHISGNNFQYGRKRGEASYFYSTIPHSWGWATWRRAWKNYDFTLLSAEERKTVWDAQWWMTVDRNNGLALYPNVNLVSNVGYGTDASHTVDQAKYMNLPTEGLKLPLIHPDRIRPDKAADRFTLKNHFGRKNLRINELKNVVRSFMKKRKYDVIKYFNKKAQKKEVKYLLHSHPKGNSYHEFWRLFNKYITIDRYTPKTISFLSYRFDVPDCASFIFQFKEIFLDELYKFEPPNPGQLTIYDCGANIGTSCLYFKQSYPNAKIIAFEADPAIAQICERNLINNGMNDVQLISKAVWINNDGVRFNSTGADNGSIYSENQDVKRIHSIRLNEYLEKEETIDFLKMDIEGAEIEVLLDCKNYMQKVRKMFVEYHSWNDQNQRLQEILSMLTENGFRYHIGNVFSNKREPFISRGRAGDMDLQLNIFAYKE